MKSVCMVVQGYYDTDIRVRRKAEALVAAGYSVDVLALRSPRNDSDRYELNGVQVRTLDLAKRRGSLVRYALEYFTFFIWVARQLPGLMDRRNYSIVEINTLPDFLDFATFSVRARGAKIVLDMHEITPEFYMSKYGIAESSWIIRLLKYVELLSMRYADHVLTINEPVQQLLESRGLPRSKSTVIMNSADTRLFSAAPHESIARPSEMPPADFAFAYHGTLTRIYGLDIAIEAFGSVHSRMPGANFFILGEGPELEPLQRLARRLGVDSKVRFVGMVPPHEVQRWLRHCDVGVLATRQDVFLDYSFSNKLSEYVLMDKAVIASRLRTIRSYFDEDALCFFEPGNTMELAEKMVKLYQEPTVRSRLATAARRQLHPIRWEVMKQRYLAVVSELTTP